MSAIRKTVVERCCHAARLEHDPLTAWCSRQRRRNHLRQGRCDIWSPNRREPGERVWTAPSPGTT